MARSSNVGVFEFIASFAIGGSETCEQQVVNVSLYLYSSLTEVDLLTVQEEFQMIQQCYIHHPLDSRINTSRQYILTVIVAFQTTPNIYLHLTC